MRTTPSTKCIFAFVSAPFVFQSISFQSGATFSIVVEALSMTRLVRQERQALAVSARTYPGLLSIVVVSRRAGSNGVQGLA
jgi:hypothetical protein